MRSLFNRVFGVPALVLIAALAFAPRPASATSYTYTATANPATASCGGNDCFIVTQFWGPTGGPVLNAGDTVTYSVTFTSPFLIGPGTAQSAIYGAILDTNYFACGTASPTCIAPQPMESSTSTESLIGYSGPASINNGPNTFPAADFYTAYSFVNGPNPGFSVTGFDATFHINSSDPFSIYAIAVESQVLNATPEPGSIAMMLLGAGPLLALGKRSLFRSRRGS